MNLIWFKITVLTIILTAGITGYHGASLMPSKYFNPLFGLVFGSMLISLIFTFWLSM
jgi:hypothetical protein